MTSEADPPAIFRSWSGSPVVVTFMGHDEKLRYVVETRSVMGDVHYTVVTYDELTKPRYIPSLQQE